jgi:uncharacterized protein YraI
LRTTQGFPIVLTKEKEEMKIQTFGENSKASWVRGLVAALLIATLLAGCAPTPTPLPPPPTNVPPPTVVPATPTPVPPAADPNYYSTEPVMVMPPGVPGQPMVEAAYNTAVLSGPGTNYVVYGAFLGGQTAVATGVSQDAQWYVISIPVAAGGIGWVSAVYVMPSNTSGLPVVAAPPVPPSTAMVPPGSSDPQATALVQTYVRTGPANNYPAYGFAKAGSTGRVLGKSQDGLWLTVRLDPTIVGLGYGWVEAAFTQQSNTGSVPVVAAPNTTPPPVNPTPPPAGTASATAVDYVNLRNGPGTNYLIVGIAPPGATGEVTGKSQDGAWWQVKVPATVTAEGVAWVSADWVTTANTGSVPVVSAPPPPPPMPAQPTPPPAGSCQLVGQTPPDGTTYPTSYGFGVTWVLKNTSSEAWNNTDVDVVFQGAMGDQRLHQGADVFDLPYTTNPGQTVTISGNGITPANAGQYGEAWALMRGQTNLCTFWIIVNAQ